MGIRSTTDKVQTCSSSESVTEPQRAFLGRIVRQITKGDRETGLANLTQVMREGINAVKSLESIGDELLRGANWIKVLDHSENNCFSGNLQAAVLIRVSHLQNIISEAIGEHLDMYGTNPDTAEADNRKDLLNLSNQLLFLLEKMGMTQEDVQAAQGKFITNSKVTSQDCDLVLADAYSWLSKKTKEAVEKNPGLTPLHDCIQSLSVKLLGIASQRGDEKRSLNREDLEATFKEMERELTRAGSISAGFCGRAGICDPMASIISEWKEYMSVMNLRSESS